MTGAFRCGHPRTPENSVSTGENAHTGERYRGCAFCRRVDSMLRVLDRRQARLNAGLSVDGRIGAARDWL